MIPPLQERRLRGISRWLKDSYPKEYGSPSQAERLSARALEIDEQMIEEFDFREALVRDRMMKEGTWGTGAGMDSFPLERMQIWGEVFQDFLPPIPEPEESETSDPNAED